MKSLGLDIFPEPRRNVAPGAFGQFVITREHERALVDGIWSLLIEPKPDGSGFRPHPKWKTFNAKSERLNSSPLWKKRFATQRAIVPISGFHEWKDKQCYQISADDQALALGGLYEFWQFGEQLVPSFSVITLPSHPTFSRVHEKSVPLILTQPDFDAWLDPAMTKTDAFQDLLQSRLPVTLNAVPINNPGQLRAVGDAMVLPADEDSNEP